VYPTLGARPIAEIRRSEIVRLLDQIEEGSGPATARLTLALIRKIMNWHASRSDDFLSPIVRGMSAAQGGETARTLPDEQKAQGGARDRTLTDDEIRKVWRTAEGYGVYGSYLRFLLLTAARRNEASDMTWNEVDGSDWTLPAARNKTKLDLLRPLSRAASQIIEGLPKAGPFVFTTNGGATAFTSFSNSKAAFDKSSGTKGWTLHDLRPPTLSPLS